MMSEKGGELTAKEWVELLSRGCEPSKERVIVTAKFGRTLKVKKEAWSSYFDSWGGIDFRQGKEIELVSAKTGGSKTDIPQSVRARLTSAPGSMLCITERGNRYFLKKLRLVECSTTIPGSTVIDVFKTDHVERRYAIFTEPAQITHDGLEELLSSMGTFRYDPLLPFKDMPGRIGILARKEFLGGITSIDKAEIEEHKKQTEETQLANGSWDNNVVTTAFNLIRLVEAGAPVEDGFVQKGVNWILSTQEPLGFPGIFMLTDEHTKRFNIWKEKQQRGKAVRSSSRNTTAKEAREYLANRDVLSSVSASPCELRMTWASGIAVEALLRCGQYDEKRVIRAINTLLTMSNGHNWCGCGYFDTREKNYIADSSEPVNFNRFPVWETNWGHGLDWFTGEREIASFVCNNRDRSALDVGSQKSLLVRHFRSTGECTMVVQRGLSFHHGYHGSNFETNVALSCTWYQGSDGSWGDAYLSTTFGLLERTLHPLAGFLVIRSIPRLIRQQKKSGLWQEKEIGGCQPPTEKETSFMILRTLKRFNYLERLLT